MSDLLGEDIFGDPVKSTPSPPATEKSSDDIFQSAVSNIKEPEMRSISLDSPPAATPVPVPGLYSRRGIFVHQFFLQQNFSIFYINFFAPKF